MKKHSFHIYATLQKYIIHYITENVSYQTGTVHNDLRKTDSYYDAPIMILFDYLNLRKHI